MLPVPDEDISRQREGKLVSREFGGGVLSVTSAVDIK
jgi:hypothetical protein